MCHSTHQTTSVCLCLHSPHCPNDQVIRAGATLAQAAGYTPGGKSFSKKWACAGLDRLERKGARITAFDESESAGGAVTVTSAFTLAPREAGWRNRTAVPCEMTLLLTPTQVFRRLSFFRKIASPAVRILCDAL